MLRHTHSPSDETPTSALVITPMRLRAHALHVTPSAVVPTLYVPAPHATHQPETTSKAVPAGHMQLGEPLVERAVTNDEWSHTHWARAVAPVETVVRCAATSAHAWHCASMLIRGWKVPTGHGRQCSHSAQ